LDRPRNRLADGVNYQVWLLNLHVVINR